MMMTPRRVAHPDAEFSDEGEAKMLDRRMGNRVAIFGLLLAAIVNIVTVVWFAASLNAAVEGLTESNLRRDQSDMRRDALQAALAAQVAQIAQQLAVVSDRVMRNSDRIDKAVR